MTAIEILEQLRHDDGLAAEIAGLDATYLQPLEQAGLALEVTAVRGRLAEALLAVQRLAAN